MPMEIQIILHQSPGDSICASILPRMLAEQYPGQYQVYVKGVATQIFENNPFVCHEPPQGETFKVENPLIHQSDSRPCHVLESFCYGLSNVLGICIECTVNKPDIFISDLEKTWMSQVQEITGKNIPYLVIFPNYKTDYTIKAIAYWQDIVDGLAGRIQVVAVGEKHHISPSLKNILDLRGKTDTRQLIRLCYNSVGGIGGESFGNHLMAALEKPYICIASGFLSPRWVWYPTTKILTSFGNLPCCKTKGCWKSRTVKINDKDEKDNSLCERPIFVDNNWYPQCQALIKSEQVIDTVISFVLQRYDFVCEKVASTPPSIDNSGFIKCDAFEPVKLI